MGVFAKLPNNRLSREVTSEAGHVLKPCGRLADFTPMCKFGKGVVLLIIWHTVVRIIWRTLLNPEKVSDGRNVPSLHVLSPDLLPLCQIVSTKVRHIIRKATPRLQRRSGVLASSVRTLSIGTLVGLKTLASFRTFVWVFRMEDTRPTELNIR
jgi:hypothetical protein